jgi:hypothetical protein
MSEGNGCNAGGHHCGGDSAFASYGNGVTGCDLSADGRSPIPSIKRPMINGAPVSEASHEFVVRESHARYPMDGAGHITGR